MTAATNPAASDPITLEVVRNKLDGIANEMQSTLVRSSFSPIVKEGLDASASLFTLEGETLAQATAIPIHLATLIPVVRTMLGKYPVPSMREGDIYIMNDPYRGGTHLPDIALVMPIFAGGRPIALSAAMTHHQDVGGMSPGSVPPNATEIFQEGIRIPPLKYRDAGEINQTLVDMLCLNVRVPETFMGDLNAQIAACSIGARRVAELAERYGTNRLPAITGELLARSEQLVRRAIERLPDGRHSYVDWLDNDGVALDELVRIEVAAEIAGDRVIIDFTGTSPQLRGPFNCVPSGAYAGAYFAVLAMSDPSIPINGGCFRPIELVLPEGTLVNPREPAPVNSRTSTIKRIAGTIIGALREARPENAPARRRGGAPRARVRRRPRGRLALRGRRAHRLRERRERRQGRGGRHRDGRLELHEPPGRGARDGRPDSPAPLRAAAGLGGPRRVPRRTRDQPRVRDPFGRGGLHPSRRAAPAPGAGHGGRRVRSARPFPSSGARAGRRRSSPRRPWCASVPGTGWRSTRRAEAATANRRPVRRTSSPPTSRAAR